jgi:hypothetical protein
MEEQDCMRAVKLERFSHDIRDGIKRGESTPWDTDEIMQEGQTRRNARKATSQEA